MSFNPLEAGGMKVFLKSPILHFIVFYLSIFLYLLLIYFFLSAPLQGQRNNQGRKNTSRLKEEGEKRVNVNKNKLYPPNQHTLPLKPLKITFAEYPGNTRITFLSAHQNTTKNQPPVWCHFLHSALKPLVIRNSSTRDSHYLQTVWLHLFFYLLYLQQDHQQFLIVPRGVTADLFLQLGTELWKEEEQAAAYTVSSTQVMAAVDRSRPPFVCQEDLQRQRGLLCRADQMTWPLKPRCL